MVVAVVVAVVSMVALVAEVGALQTQQLGGPPQAAPQLAPAAVRLHLAG